MKALNRKAMGRVVAGGLLACMAVVVAAGPVAAAEDDAPGAPAAAPQMHGWDHHGDGERHDDWQHHSWHHHHRDRAAMFHELGLTDAQRASVKSILEAAKPAMKELHEKLHANFKLLQQTTPDDKNYSQVAAKVSQENGALTAKLIGARSKVFTQCYALLAPVQKIRLAELQAKRARWMEERKQHTRDGHRPRPDGAMDGSEAPPGPST